MRPRMKPTNKEINDRLRECFSSLPSEPGQIRKLLRSGGIYCVRRLETHGPEVCIGSRVLVENLNSATELIQKYGKCTQSNAQ